MSSWDRSFTSIYKIPCALLKNEYEENNEYEKIWFSSLSIFLILSKSKRKLSTSTYRVRDFPHEAMTGIRLQEEIQGLHEHMVMVLKTDVKRLQLRAVHHLMIIGSPC